MSLMDQLPWYENRRDLLNLYNFLNEIGLEPEMPDFLEKPDKWEDEYKIMEDNPDWNNYDSDQLDALSSQILGEDE